MRDLDIPGLSVAISKHEKLKFAAGNSIVPFINVFKALVTVT